VRSGYANLDFAGHGAQSAFCPPTVTHIGAPGFTPITALAKIVYLLSVPLGEVQGLINSRVEKNSLQTTSKAGDLRTLAPMEVNDSVVTVVARLKLLSLENDHRTTRRVPITAGLY